MYPGTLYLKSINLKLALFLTLSGFFFSTSMLYSQVRGRVWDANTGIPLANARVIALANKNETLTDALGEFGIDAQAEIEISLPGYKSVKVTVGDKYLQIGLQAYTLELGEVVVSAFNSKRSLASVAAPISIITKTDLNRADNTTLIPVLNAVPGIKLDYYTYNDYRLNIRGGALAQPSVHSSGYRMYWNDIPITSASGGNPLSGLDLNFISSMEIIKGPGSSMYGAGFGGTVLLSTERGSAEGTDINADLMVGTFGTWRSSLGAKSVWGKGNIALQYTHAESEGYREMTDTRSDILNAFGQLYVGEKGTFSYLFNYENRNVNIAGDLDSVTFYTAPKTANTIMPTGFGPDKFTVGTGYAHQFNANWELRGGAYFFDNKGEFVLSFPFFAIFDKEPSSGLNSRAVLTHRRTVGNTRLELSLGAEFANAKNEGISYNGDFNTDTAVVININEALTKQLLGFAQAEFRFPKEVYLNLGFSYNLYDYDVKSGVNAANPIIYATTVDKIAPRISLLKKFGTHSIYGAVGQGFNPPAAGIFNDFLNFDGTVNADLKASTGWNYELGGRGTIVKGLVFYDVAFYSLNVRNAIISRLFEISPGVNAERKTNAGEVSQTGIETLVGFNMTLDTDNFWYGTQLRVGYTYNDFEYKAYRTFKTVFDADFNSSFEQVDYSGKEVPGTIPNSWVILADVKTKAGWYLNYTLNTYDATFLTNENTSILPAYNIMNLRIGYRRNLNGAGCTLHPYAGINNLGNTLYSGLTAYNSTFGGFFNPGYRRQFFLGLQVMFKI